MPATYFSTLALPDYKGIERGGIRFPGGSCPPVAFCVVYASGTLWIVVDAHQTTIYSVRGQFTNFFHPVNGRRKECPKALPGGGFRTSVLASFDPAW